MSTLAVLTAAGSGARLGHAVPKALVELGGVPLLVHAAQRLCASGVVDALVVTAPPGHVDEVARLVRAAPGIDLPVHVVDGGPTRQASVAAGLRAGLDDRGLVPPAAGEIDVVLVHDAARPLAPTDLVRRVEQAVRAGYRAVVPGLVVTDTVKRVVPAPGGGIDEVAETVDRASLRAVQTPQGFDRDLLERAHAAAAAGGADESSAATDDAGLVEALGETVHVVAGSSAAAKITTGHDLRVAALTLEETA
ncbi:2-C-methyl-D-erythritol 4-phosphate cytidylyltransferase [Cellulosimicrobium arenosum]|uniref:2-C-methyl-D-erythritol 4-phosphate cytidylyltransferase n=1 Tax=Cellulosimicrobium arenosum TaxID=2708133 RepID=A0A927G9P3_9MICO|nr:2-C-methyl-D-erythritol 4-phosphate cytidylyltransferase [Cellulosimicrobium arenosum]